MSGLNPGPKSMAQRVARGLVNVVVAAAWAFVCVIQVGLVASRLFSTEPWLLWNQIAGTVLVYLPIGLASAAAWLTRKKPLTTVAVAHVVAMPLPLIFWVL